jgi:transposase
LSERPHRVRTWAPRGQTPIIKHRFNWKNASIIAGITKNSFYFNTCDGAVRSLRVISFLKHLRRHLKRKLLIVWDGVPTHRSRQVSAYIESTKGGIVVSRLPAYAPELNPAEFIFGYLKERKIPNFCPDSIHETKKIARASLRSMRLNPSLVRSFWIGAKLYQ